MGILSKSAKQQLLATASFNKARVAAQVNERHGRLLLEPTRKELAELQEKSRGTSIQRPVSIFLEAYSVGSLQGIASSYREIRQILGMEKAARLMAAGKEGGTRSMVSLLIAMLELENEKRALEKED